jgi:hypothetical protein
MTDGMQQAVVQGGRAVACWQLLFLTDKVSKAVVTAIRLVCDM